MQMSPQFDISISSYYRIQLIIISINGIMRMNLCSNCDYLLCFIVISASVNEDSLLIINLIFDSFLSLY